MSKVLYEKLHDIWLEIIEKLKTTGAITEEINSLIHYPEINAILSSISSVYTGIECEGGDYRFSPRFGDPPEIRCYGHGLRSQHALVRLTGDTNEDMKKAWGFVDVSTGIFCSNAIDREKIISEYTAHYNFMGCLDKDENPRGTPHLGGIRWIIIADNYVIPSCKEWYTGHWCPHKIASIELIPNERLNAIKGVMEIVDRYAKYNFSQYLDARQQYSCIAKYIMTTSDETMNYNFVDIRNYMLQQQFGPTKYGALEIYYTASYEEKINSIDKGQVAIPEISHLKEICRNDNEFMSREADMTMVVKNNYLK